MTCSVALLAGGGVASAVALGATGHGKKKPATRWLKPPTSTTVRLSSNRDSTHEADESSAGESDDTAGRVGPGLGRRAHGSGEDATHESGESAGGEGD